MMIIGRDRYRARYPPEVACHIYAGSAAITELVKVLWQGYTKLSSTLLLLYSVIIVVVRQLTISLLFTVLHGIISALCVLCP